MNNHIGTLYNYALVNESSYKLEQFLHPYPVVSRERISNGMLPTVVYGNGNIFIQYCCPIQFILYRMEKADRFICMKED